MSEQRVTDQELAASEPAPLILLGGRNAADLRGEPMSVKGYVVRGKDMEGLDVYPEKGTGTIDIRLCVTTAQESAALYTVADEAAGVAAEMMREFDVADVSIYRVAEDGTETALPSYEEALAKVEALTDESAAGWAIAKARLKVIEEQAAAIEQSKSDAALAADPQVFRYATVRAGEAERINWLLQGLADKTVGAAADVDLPAPLREAIDALGKANHYERVPPAITRAIPTKDAEDVRRVGFELLTCALCWDPKARLVGNLTAAQIADAAVGAMVAGGLSADEAHLSRIRVVETLLRDGDAALREASVYADEGEPIAERVRDLAAERDAFRTNASTWRTTADAHCNTIAERDKEIDRLRAENDSDRGMHEAQLASVAAERDHLKDRERSIIEACERVADGGQYRADIVSAIQTIRKQRDDAKTEIARLTADLTKLGALKSAEIAPIIDRFTAAFGVDVPHALSGKRALTFERAIQIGEKVHGLYPSEAAAVLLAEFGEPAKVDPPVRHARHDRHCMIGDGVGCSHEPGCEVER